MSTATGVRVYAMISMKWPSVLNTPISPITSHTFSGKACHANGRPSVVSTRPTRPV